MIREQKNTLRKFIKEQKKKISPKEKQRRSGIIWNKLEQDNTFRNACTLMIYWSMKDEVHTHDFIQKWHPSKQIILPVVNGNHLDLKIYAGPESMKKGQSFGILEPEGESFTELQDIDLIIVPGVAFDKNNNRLGRGKAYYDKLLNYVNCHKYGVCFDFQLVPNVPADQHDVKMDKVITDS